MRNQEAWFLTNLMLKDEKKINKKIQSKKNNKKTRIKPDMHKKKKNLRMMKL
jgi:hypothetical protein